MILKYQKQQRKEINKASTESPQCEELLPAVVCYLFLQYTCLRVNNSTAFDFLTRQQRIEHSYTNVSFSNNLLADRQKWKHQLQLCWLDKRCDHTDSRCSGDSPSTEMTPSMCSILTAPQHSRTMAIVCRLLSFCCSLSIFNHLFLSLGANSSLINPLNQVFFFFFLKSLYLLTFKLVSLYSLST